MKSNIIDKVKKLLTKAGSTDSPAEAESLFTMAQKLMVKHRIAQSDLDQADQPSILDSEVFCFANRLEGNWELRLARTLARPNCCDFVYSKFKSQYTKNVEQFNKITFYGTEQDIQLVKFFFETTRETFRRIARSEYRRLFKEGQLLPGKNQFIRSFLLGACDGLATKMTVMTAQHVAETQSTTYDIMVRSQLDKVKQHMSTHVNVKSVTSRTSAGSSAGYNTGVLTGKKHSLHIPVTSSASASSKKQLS